MEKQNEDRESQACRAGGVGAEQDGDTGVHHQDCLSREQGKGNHHPHSHQPSS